MQAVRKKRVRERDRHYVRAESGKRRKMNYADRQAAQERLGAVAAVEVVEDAAGANKSGGDKRATKKAYARANDRQDKRRKMKSPRQVRWTDPVATEFRFEANNEENQGGEVELELAMLGGDEEAAGWTGDAGTPVVVGLVVANSLGTQAEGSEEMGLAAEVVTSSMVLSALQVEVLLQTGEAAREAESAKSGSDLDIAALANDINGHDLVSAPVTAIVALDLAPATVDALITSPTASEQVEFDFDGSAMEVDNSVTHFVDEIDEYGNYYSDDDSDGDAMSIDEVPLAAYSEVDVVRPPWAPTPMVFRRLPAGPLFFGPAFSGADDRRSSAERRWGIKSILDLTPADRDCVLATMLALDRRVVAPLDQHKRQRSRRPGVASRVADRLLNCGERGMNLTKVGAEWAGRARGTRKVQALRKGGPGTRCRSVCGRGGDNNHGLVAMGVPE